MLWSRFDSRLLRNTFAAKLASRFDVICSPVKLHHFLPACLPDEQLKVTRTLMTFWPSLAGMTAKKDRSKGAIQARVILNAFPIPTPYVSLSSPCASRYIGKESGRSRQLS